MCNNTGCLFLFYPLVSSVLHELNSSLSSESPWGHGRLHMRVMDVLTDMAVFQKIRRPDQSFLDVRQNDPRMFS